MSHVVKVKKEQIPEIKETLLESKTVTELKPTNPYEVFRLQYRDEVIVAYTSGKVVTSGELSAKILSSAIVQTPSEEIHQTVVGSDEAGKGEWLGPLVVAAVAVSPDQRKTLVSKGVMDSKLLSLGVIRELAEFVKKASINFKVVTISPVRFNELMMDVKDEGKSLNDILAWGHALAIKTLTEKLPPGPKKVRIVIDEFDKLKTEQRLWRVINRQDFDVMQHPRAEEEVAVAAASILARDEREHWIDRRSNIMHQDLRKLNLSEALLNPSAYSFAKITYLKQGGSQTEVQSARLLQNAIAIEYELRTLAEELGSVVQSKTVSELSSILAGHKLITKQLLDKIQAVVNVRNEVVHSTAVSPNDLAQAVDVSSELLHSLRNMLMHGKKSDQPS